MYKPDQPVISLGLDGKRVEAVQFVYHEVCSEAEKRWL